MNMAVFWHFFVSAGCVRLTGTKTDLWIATRSMEWKPFEDHSFFVARNAHKGFIRISGWIKMPP